MNKYQTHTHRGDNPRYCRYCVIEKAWNGRAQNIAPVPDRRGRTLVLCRSKHSCVLSDTEVMQGCPLCRLGDPTMHTGLGYITRESNLTRHTCADCGEVYFAKYGAERLACAAGHSILSDADSVRVNVIAALELVIGWVADDWFLHCYADFHACSMGYKIIAFIGTPEEYTAKLAEWDVKPQSQDYSMEKIVDARFPDNLPYLWLTVRIDPARAHDFEACVERFIEGTNLHEWLRDNRRQDIPERLAEYRNSGRRFSLDTKRPKFPAPRLLPARQRR